MAESSSGKESKTVDFKLCLICQWSSKQTDYTNYVLHPSLLSVEKLIATTDIRCSYGEIELSALNNRISGLSTNDVLQKSVSYHKTCYKDLTNKTHIERTKLRYEKVQLTGTASDVSRRKKDDHQHPYLHVLPHHDRHIPEVRLSTEMCVICQEDKADNLHDVSTAPKVP